MCVQCSSGEEGQTLSNIMVVFGMIILFFILFLIGWRLVFVDNVLHKGYDTMLDVLAKHTKKFLLLFSTGETAGEAYNFMKDPNIRKHLPQAFKILIGLSLHCS